MDIVNYIDPKMVEMFYQILIAAALGLAIGMERTAAHKTAGMRTYALISMGSALFVIISHSVASKFIGITNFDPLRVASQIVVGIGFVGGGLIMVRGTDVRGLTTAAGIWVAAGIGMATGFGLYELATFVTIITLLIFTILWHVEEKVRIISTKIYRVSKDRHEDDSI